MQLTVIKFLIRTTLFLVIVALATATYLLSLEGKQINWRELITMPDFQWPDLQLPSWTEIRDYLPDRDNSSQADRPSNPSPDSAWVTRPGQEPPTFAPFTPATGVHYNFPTGTYFKWQDASGAWQYSQTPRIGVRNTPIATNPQQNVMPAKP